MSDNKIERGRNNSSKINGISMLKELENQWGSYQDQLNKKQHKQKCDKNNKHQNRSRSKIK